MREAPLPQLTRQTAAMLNALIDAPGSAGAQISQITGLKSGTLYPILLRLEAAGWLRSEWEVSEAADLKRPRRRFYWITVKGAAQAREAAQQHITAFGRLAWN